MPEIADYNEAINSTIFSVKADTILTINVDDIVYGLDAIVDVTLTDVAGNNLTDVVVTVTINGKTYPITVVNGKGSTSVADLAAGDNYNASAVFEGNVLYNNATASDLFNVLKNTPEINVNGVDVTYPGDVVVWIISNVAGEYNVTVAGKTETVTLEAGLVDFVTFTGVAANEAGYVINATVAESENFTAAFNDTEIVKVFRAASSIVINPITNATYDDSVTIDFTIQNVTSYVITVVDKDNNPVKFINATVEIVNGTETGFVTVSGVAAGVYNITIANADDVNYTASSASALFEVYKAAPTIEVITSDVTYPDDVLVWVASDVAGDVIVKVGDQNQTVTLEADVAVLLNFTGLAANEEGYVINATRAGSDNYTDAVNDTETVKVMKATVVITPEIEGELFVNTQFNVTFTLPGDVDGIVTVTVNDNIVLYSKEGDKYVVSFDAMPAGNYTFVVELAGDTNYNDANASIEFTVSKLTPEITISDINGTVGETVMANVTIDGGDATGTILFNGEEYVVKDGKAVIPVAITQVGMQSINVTYSGDERYFNGTGVKAFNAGKGTSTIAILLVTTPIGVGDDAIVTFMITPEELVDNNVTVWINGVEYGSFVFENATDAFIITGDEFPVEGSYNITVQYMGDVNYNPSNKDSYLIDVVKVDPDMDVEGDIIDYGEVATITVTLPEDANGTVNVTIDGVGTFNATVEDGIAVIEIPGLVAGEYNDLVVVYSGDVRYNNATETADIYVDQADPEIDSEATEDAKYGEDVTITVYLPEDAAGNVTIVVDDVIVASDLPVSNGTVEFNVSGLSAGPHDYAIAYSGDDNYETALDAGSFEIAKAEGNVTATVEAGTADDPVNITVTGPSDANGLVLVTIDGENVTFAQMKDGSVVIPVSDLAAGPHNLTVTYLGDNNYGNASYTTSFEIEENPTNTTISVVVDRFDVEVTVNVNSTSIVNEGTVTLTFNDQNTTAVVDNGVAVFKFTNLDAKTYAIVASYGGTSKFLPSNATGNATVKRVASYIKPVYQPFIFNYGQLYKFRLTDKQGNPIAGRTIEFSVHSKVYYVKTDSDGWGQIQLTTAMLIHADKIFSRLIFRGDTQYKPATYAVWFNAMQEPAKFTNVKALKSSYKVSEKNKQVTATLKDSKNKVIAGKKVTITVNGKTITGKTNSKGVVTFNLNAVKFNVGKATYKLIFEDVNYKRTTYQGTINIAKD
jgi:hypothetical protein